MLRLLGQLSTSRWVTTTTSNITLPARQLSTETAVSSDRSWIIQRWKHPVRGGQNLSERYRRLQRSIRGKEAYEKRISDLKGDDDSAATRSPAESRAATTFMGFVVPEEPNPPADDECCMSGCAICVYDLYEEASTDYKKSVDSLRTSLQALNIPEDAWPESIQLTPKKPTKKPSITLSAFEELERKLREKKAQQASPVG